MRLFPRQVDVENEQRDQSHDRNVVGRRANLPELSPIHKFSATMWGQPPSAVGPGNARQLLVPRTEQSSFARPDSRGRLSPQKSVYSPAAFGPRRGLSASAPSITGAGPEIPPSFRTRQKCTIINTDATIGMPIQCQM